MSSFCRLTSPPKSDFVFLALFLLIWLPGWASEIRPDTLGHFCLMGDLVHTDFFRCKNIPTSGHITPREHLQGVLWSERIWSHLFLQHIRTNCKKFTRGHSACVACNRRVPRHLRRWIVNLEPKRGEEKRFQLSIFREGQRRRAGGLFHSNSC